MNKKLKKYQGCNSCSSFPTNCFILSNPIYVGNCPCQKCLVKIMCNVECSERAAFCTNIFLDMDKENTTR